MSSGKHLVVFTLDKQRFALHLACVLRVVSVVEITPLPKAPPIVLGIVNVEGKIVPVLDIRKRFRLLERGVELTDQLIIAHTTRRVVAFEVDRVDEVVQCLEQDLIDSQSILPGLEYVEGVIKLTDGLILIHDLDQFFSLEEERTLDEAMMA